MRVLTPKFGTATRISPADGATVTGEESDKKDGPSGIGKENYTWYQQNVHLVPLTWEDEVRLLKRELDRDLVGIKYLFISSVAQTGLEELKDELWKAIND